MSNSSPRMESAEHPLDVLQAAMRFHNTGEQITLVIITATEGGAVRSKGAMMVVGEDGSRAGYLSGGCIDEDVAARCSAAMTFGQTEHIRYGKGSPFLDIRLPCGGAIELAIIPHPSISVVQAIISKLVSRQAAHYAIGTDGLRHDQSNKQNNFQILPKLKLRIAGKGCEPIALAKLANACGLMADVWTPDVDCAKAAEEYSNVSIETLSVPSELPDHRDDDFTAFALMFHDQDWEVALLEHALAGPAFFVGAVGSRTTHSRRVEALKDRGIPDQRIESIRAPIGLIPSMKDASMLAVSTFAEIVEAYTQQQGAT